ncbi:cytochrome P450 [Pleomassaria siparia CBS 279.74]|uniref:Cytochrome P450 n=1 Tax=Pleomassaria siparia CBS 279.74 TaxID=1314801 RepID=A0A6G1KPQ5_9PLEO|nr:cytochrome P450 [Pleomassaria siparia CBS 279.74]
MDATFCAGLATLSAFTLRSVGAYDVNGWPSVSHLLALFTALYLPLKYYRIFFYPWYLSPLRHLPTPTNNFLFFGQAINFVRASSPVELYVKWMREWPDAPVIRYLTFGNTEVLVANSLESFRELLQTKCYEFCKPDRWHRIVGEIIGKGVINMEGDEHRAARRMLTGTFNVPNSRKLIPVFQAKAKEVSALFERAIAGGNDGDGTGVFTALDAFQSFTLDTFGVVNLGVELNHLRSITFDDDKIEGKKVKEKDGGWTFHKAYEIIFAPGPLGGMLMFANGFVPVRWLPIKENKDFADACAFLKATLKQLISERIQTVHTAIREGTYEKEKSRDLLTFICEEMVPGGPAEGLTEYHVLGHMLQFMAAGGDTSANTLSWSAYILSKHQHIQDKLRAEIQALYTNDPTPAYSSIDALPYLDAFIKEILRLYSPAATIHRQATKDLTIDGVLVTEGTVVDVVGAVTHLNPLIWGEDADMVRPERWFPENTTAKMQNLHAFQAFSNGPRICIGKVAAMIELKTLFVEIVLRYRFIKVETEPVFENPSLVLKPTRLRVRVRRVN